MSTDGRSDIVGSTARPGLGFRATASECGDSGISGFREGGVGRLLGLELYGSDLRVPGLELGGQKLPGLYRDWR